MPTTQKLIELGVPPIIETAVLVRLVLPGTREAQVEESLEELGRLAWTAGAKVVCTVVQHRPKPCPATLIGKGKASEIAVICDEVKADLVIFDSDLSPTQGAKLEDLLGRKVVDRTQLILDIFAQRARTNEGKHQVELAQLKYMLPRLVGRGSIMRQEGGIGVRGPGEQKLEVDRRVIRARIARLESEIEAIRRHRRVQRKRRSESAASSVALVGYTNAGKSSLLNALTGAEAFVEDKLFATLDPLARRCALPSGRTAVFSDTVGFVRNLPHTLVAAFRATLEEVAEADLLLVVADAVDPNVEDHIRVVFQVLDEIEVGQKPLLKVFNKIDIAEPGQVRQLLAHEGPADDSCDCVAVSALTHEGLTILLEKVDRLLGKVRPRLHLRIPQQEAGLVARVYDVGRVFRHEYEGNEIVLEAEVPPELDASLRPFVDSRTRPEDEVCETA